MELGEVPPERQIVKDALSVAWPSVLESFFVNLAGVVDTIMVGSLGSYAIAAVGLTTQPKFLGLAVFISLNVAVSAIVARRKGAGDRESANRVVRMLLLFTLILTALISVVFVIFAGPIVSLVGSQPDTHEYAVEYLRIIMGGSVFSTVSLVLNAAQRGAGNTRIAMVTNVISNLVNVIFNYLLIGGNFGFPALGVRGAAIATVIGTVCACTLSIVSVLHKDGFIYLLWRWLLRGGRHADRTESGQKKAGHGENIWQCLSKDGTDLCVCHILILFLVWKGYFCPVFTGADHLGLRRDDHADTECDPLCADRASGALWLSARRRGY